MTGEQIKTGKITAEAADKAQVEKAKAEVVNRRLPINAKELLAKHKEVTKYTDRIKPDAVATPAPTETTPNDNNNNDWGGGNDNAPQPLVDNNDWSNNDNGGNDDWSGGGDTGGNDNGAGSLVPPDQQIVMDDGSTWGGTSEDGAEIWFD